MVPGGTRMSGGDRAVAPRVEGGAAARRASTRGLGGDRASLSLRVAAVALVVVAAYAYSLSTLVGTLGTNTPLAYLGLVPLISVLLMAGLLYLRGRPDRDIHDRYVDYLAGIPLLGIALLIVLVGPAQMSTFFWLWRLDLISLPLFVAGAIALVFGTRMLWRLRFPVAFLFLAWPPLYTQVLSGLLSGVTTVTLAALRAAVSLLPVAVPMSYGDGSLFQVTHRGAPFVLSVASACSGVDGVLGFLLVGGAAAALVRGPRGARAAWLAVGIAMIWALNVVRILAIFAAGAAWGEGFAIDALHPVAGLLVFALSVAIMILLMPRFGLHLLGSEPKHTAASAPTSRPRPGWARLAVGRAGVALLLVLAAGAAVGYSDSQMSAFGLLAQNLGPPQLQPFSVAAAAVPGRTLTPIATFDFAKLEFGANSTWDRYLYLSRSPAAPAVTLDVISTPHLGSFSTYTVQDCYDFHGYQPTGVHTVALGAGVMGTTTVYQVTATERWTAVYWEWPVAAPDGQVYQRVVLNELTSGSEAASEAQLTALAQEVVRATAHQARGGVAS